MNQASRKETIFDKTPLLVYLSSDADDYFLNQLPIISNPDASLLIRYLYLVTIQRGLASCESKQRSEFTQALLTSDQALMQWLDKESDIKSAMKEAFDRSILGLKEKI